MDRHFVFLPKFRQVLQLEEIGRKGRRSESRSGIPICNSLLAVRRADSGRPPHITGFPGNGSVLC